jgi:AcrR family transcriptional regulator
MEFSSQYATKVFMRLTPEKQQTVFNAAAAEFARHGYDAANTNVIARRAGVSVGSLFQYFSTKQSLFLALVDYGTQTLLSPVLDMAREAPDALALFRFMLIQARTFAHTHPDYNRIYLGVTAQLPSTMGTLLAPPHRGAHHRLLSSRHAQNAGGRRPESPRATVCCPSCWTISCSLTSFRLLPCIIASASSPIPAWTRRRTATR